MGPRPLGALLLLFLGACQRSAPPVPAAPEAVAEETPPPEQVPPAAPLPPSPPALPPLLALRLAQEAEARPTGTPRAEDVLAALQAAGLRLGEPQQYLASSSGARYCYGAHSERGLHVSVCEHADAASASSARRRFLRALGSAERNVLLNRATLLRVQRPAGNPDAEAEARLAAQTFQKL